MNRIRVLLVDDQVLFREGLHTLLSVQPEIEVVGEASNGEEALALAVRFQPDVVLMDVQMPVQDGVAATRQLKRKLPYCHVIMLTTFDDDEYVFEGLRAGALGYVLKDTSSENLLNAIRAAARGESFLQPSVAAKVVSEFARLNPAPASPTTDTEPLTARERDILRLMVDGLSNREIADELVITEGTVKNHVTNILSKLGVQSRTQAALKAKQSRLI
jgi:DNA-binding NarL/FixJ family response regulator